MTNEKHPAPKLRIPLNERGEHPLIQKADASPPESERKHFETRDRLRYVASEWHCLWNTLGAAFHVDHGLKSSEQAIKEISERFYSRPEGLTMLANEIDHFIHDARPCSENLDDLITEGFSMTWDFQSWEEFAEFLEDLKVASLAVAKGMSE